MSAELRLSEANEILKGLQNQLIEANKSLFDKRVELERTQGDIAAIPGQISWRSNQILELAGNEALKEHCDMLKRTRNELTIELEQKQKSARDLPGEIASLEAKVLELTQSVSHQLSRIETLKQ